MFSKNPPVLQCKRHIFQLGHIVIATNLLSVQYIKKSTTFCFGDDFWAGAGFNSFNALASRVLTALQPCDTLGAGFNGINALDSRVLTALQPRDPFLSQCDILERDVCPGNVQHDRFIQYWHDRYTTIKILSSEMLMY